MCQVKYNMNIWAMEQYEWHKRETLHSATRDHTHTHTHKGATWITARQLNYDTNKHSDEKDFWFADFQSPIIQTTPTSTVNLSAVPCGVLLISQSMYYS